MRLINADYALSALGIFNDREHGNEHFLNGIETAREIIEQAPAIDAVHVIRCKDCEFWNYKDCVVDGNCYCDMLERYTLENFYCAAGKRREADADTP